MLAKNYSMLCIQTMFCRHGGPGGGCSPVDRRFYDPSVYRIILMDQRGSGKSTPPAELKVQGKSEIGAQHICQ